MASRTRSVFCCLAAVLLWTLPGTTAQAGAERAAPAAKNGSETLRKVPSGAAKPTNPQPVKPKSSKAKAAKTVGKKPKKDTPVLQKVNPNQGLTYMLPDLQVEITSPGSNSQPALAKVHNKGTTAVSAAFLTEASAEVSCEAGKLKSNVPLANKTTSLQPIAAGGFRTVSILPASGQWVSSGCYFNVQLAADTGGSISESNEKNNKGFAHFCPHGGSCY